MGQNLLQHWLDDVSHKHGILSDERELCSLLMFQGGVPREGNPLDLLCICSNTRVGLSFLRLASLDSGIPPGISGAMRSSYGAVQVSPN